MGVLTEIPSTAQINAARLAVEVGTELGEDIPRDIREMAAWPLEKAWNWKPPAHPIPEGYDPHAG